MKANKHILYFVKVMLLTLWFFILFFNSAYSQKKIITLQQTISIATDSSVQALNARNKYLQGYWQYHNFKVYHLPKITLQTNPMSYNRFFAKRYDSEKNIDIYREQQSFNSSGNISIQQNLGFTGGAFFIDSELDYLKNFGANNSNVQFSSVPIRIGYSQNLFGFNSYKWDKIIEPIRYGKAQKQLLYDIASTAETAANYFFDLATSQTIMKLAEQNLANADTLYQIGQVRNKLGSLTKVDLLTLKLQKLNSKQALEKAKLNLVQSYGLYCVFLGADIQDPNIQVQLPSEIGQNEISIEKAVEMAIQNNPIISEIDESESLAQRNFEQTKKNRFSAQIRASLGFNQIAGILSDVYKRPSQQNMVSVSFSIPIVDWGVSKGKLIVARENLKVTKASNVQLRNKLIQDVEMNVRELNLYRAQIDIAAEAEAVAAEAFNMAKELFLVGKIDLNSINMAIASYMDAQNGYVQALKSYWVSYYRVKKLTLWN